jgi:hypothetical protein
MPNRTRTAHCRRTAFGRAVLRFHYNAPLINNLKAAVQFTTQILARQHLASSGGDPHAVTRLNDARERLRNGMPA